MRELVSERRSGSARWYGDLPEPRPASAPASWAPPVPRGRYRAPGATPALLALLVAVFALSPPELQAAQSELVPAAPEVKGPGRPGKGEGRNLHYFKYGGKYGFVTPDGRMAIAPEYSFAENFAAQGVARAGDGKGTGLLDARGAWVVLPLLKNVTPEEGEGADGYVAVNYSWHGRLGPDARWTVAPRFQELKPLGHGYYSYKFRGKYGIIAPDGKFATGAVFEKLGAELSKRPDGTFLMPFT
ncbi:MAG: WG repeat-containing protein, partial [Deltaproteobacteria bacterium]|nr:WG repeat-containing protein [Deltaproteobacteria bacterium]